MRYRFCDLVIDSELPLPELGPAGTDGETFVFRVEAGHAAPAELEWFHEWRYPDGEPWSAFARIAHGYLCRFEGIGDYLLTDHCTTIVCGPEPGVPDDTITHIFLNQIMPIVLSMGGERSILHASAVAIEGRAVAFLGRTGQGKSTLAGSFCAAGYALLTDDCLVLHEGRQGFVAVPTYAGLRLWEDAATAVAGAEATAGAPIVAHYTEKKRIDLGNLALPFCDRSVQVDRFYFLTDALDEGCDGVTITSVPPREALVELTRYSFHLDLWVGNARQEEFARLAELTAEVPSYRLSYPRALDQLDTVRGSVLRHLEDRSMPTRD
jgi:hypothetical protein